MDEERLASVLEEIGNLRRQRTDLRLKVWDLDAAIQAKRDELRDITSEGDFWKL